MITKVSVAHDPRRKLPWIVRWFGDVDHETGRQRRYSKSFRHSRDAKAFHVEKQAELNKGALRDKPQAVAFGRLLDEFTEARIGTLSHSAQAGYRNTITQLREHFGDGRDIRQIEQRHAETFMATRKRLDGRPTELSTWSRKHHLKHCRAIFSAAVEWGYVDRDPFVPPNSQGNSPLRVKPKSKRWHHLPPPGIRHCARSGFDGASACGILAHVRGRVAPG